MTKVEDRDNVVDIPLKDRIPELEEQVKRYLQIIKPLPENTIKYTRVKVPIFKNLTEKNAWEREQIRRCIIGFNGLTGKMYFWINFCYIKNLKGGKIAPEFRNADKVWFEELEDSKNKAEGIVCVKRRRAGFSWKAASDALHDAMFSPFFVVGMNSKTERDSIHLFSKILFIYDNLPQFLRSRVGSKRGMNLRFHVNDKDENGNPIKRGLQSEINVVPPTDSAYEGLMLGKWICDEAGKIPNLPQMWSYTEDCLMQETVRYGQPIIFGTSGDISKDGSGLMGMWENSDVYKLRRFFFGGWMGLSVDEFGNDRVEECVRWIVYERKRRENLPGKFYSDFLQRYPLTPEEAFNQYTESGIGDITLINRQIASLTDNPVKEKRGHFVIDENGKVTFNVTPLGKIIMYEDPDPNSLYVAGCLPAGEKVLTDSGLKDIEKVDFSDRLISKDGDYVSIKELQKYRVNETLYEVQMKNTFRTTKFTGEHPLYVSPNVKGYTSFDKKKRENLRYSYQKFDFDFKPMKEISIGEWTKFPNIYRKEVYKESKLDNLDVAWFLGLWLGDGWVDKGKRIVVCVNNNELAYLERIQSVTSSNISTVERVGCIEVSFVDESLSRLINEFGSYAYGKRIPEWVKFLPANIKSSIVAGYIDSDGCVTEDKRRGHFVTEIVSINLELLEDVQDILFSIGLISSTSLLRKAKDSEIRGRTVHQKDTYRLRMGNHYSKLLKESTDKSFKLSSKSFIDSRNNKMGCFFSDDLSYIYFQIVDIKKYHIDDWVYNFHCETSTYLCKNITTHNCDPADHDDATSESSDLSLHVVKKQHGTVGPKIVLEYVDRPDNLVEYYNQSYYAMLYYNKTKLLVERNRYRMISHFTSNNWQSVLATTPQGLSRLFSVRSNSIGLHMNVDVKNYMKGIISEYIKDYSELIPSKKLLQEFVGFGAMNTDRVFSFGLALILMKEDKRSQSSGNKRKIPTYKYKQVNGRIIRVTN